MCLEIFRSFTMCCNTLWLYSVHNYLVAITVVREKFCVKKSGTASYQRLPSTQNPPCDIQIQLSLSVIIAFWCGVSQLLQALWGYPAWICRQVILQVVWHLGFLGCGGWWLRLTDLEGDQIFWIGLQNEKKEDRLK